MVILLPSPVLEPILPQFGGPGGTVIVAVAGLDAPPESLAS
jgi:hypothetical protein